FHVTGVQTCALPIFARSAQTPGHQLVAGGNFLKSDEQVAFCGYKCSEGRWCNVMVVDGDQSPQPTLLITGYGIEHRERIIAPTDSIIPGGDEYISAFVFQTYLSVFFESIVLLCTTGIPKNREHQDDQHICPHK